LRAAAPEFDFVELDLLDVLPGRDIIASTRDCIEAALRRVQAVVRAESLRLRLVRAALTGAGAPLLNAFSRSKRNMLLADELYVRKQLCMLVGNHVIVETLLQEAKARIADPRMDGVTNRAAEVVRGLLRPLDGAIDAATSRRATFDEGRAPMLEHPDAVAMRLRALLAGAI
jgi:hypothetical protein